MQFAVCSLLHNTNTSYNSETTPYAEYVTKRPFISYQQGKLQCSLPLFPACKCNIYPFSGFSHHVPTGRKRYACQRSKCSWSFLKRITSISTKHFHQCTSRHAYKQRPCAQPCLPPCRQYISTKRFQNDLLCQYECRQYVLCCFRPSKPCYQCYNSTSQPTCSFLQSRQGPWPPLRCGTTLSPSKQPYARTSQRATRYASISSRSSKLLQRFPTTSPSSSLWSWSTCYHYHTSRPPLYQQGQVNNVKRMQGA